MENNYQNRPSQLIDPQKKDKDWCLKMVKSIYSSFQSTYPHSYSNGKATFKESKDYVLGLQDPAKYFESKDQGKTQNKDLTTGGYDKRILNVISKYYRRIYGALLDYNISFSMNPVDPLALDHIAESKSKMEALMALKEILGSQGSQFVGQLSQELGIEVPEDSDELEIKLNTSIPMQFASESEMALEWANDLDRFNAKQRECIKDLVAHSKMAMKTTLNANGYPTSEHVSVANLMVGYHEREDGRDINEIGEIRMVTISDMMVENKEQSQLTTEDAVEIEKNYQGKHDNSLLFNQNTGNSDSFLYSDNFFKYRVNVLDVFWYSYDGDSQVSYKTEEGNIRSLTKPFSYYSKSEENFKKNYKNGEITKTTNKHIYRASWVIGTNYLYNFGYYRATDIVDYLPYSLELPIIMQEPLMMNGVSVSIVQEMIPISDKCNQFWKLMENSINNFRPKGYRLNIDGFIKAADNYKGQIGLSVKQMMQMAFKENIILESGELKAGQSNKTFEEIQGGLGVGFSEAFKGLVDCLNLLESITGFGGVTTGNPSQYATKGTSEIAERSADYTIRHLFDAKKDFHQRVMRQRAILLEYSKKKGLCKGLSYKLDGTKKYTELPKNIHSYVCSLIVEDAPTQQDIMEFKQYLMQATQVPLNQGGIRFDQQLQLMDMRNLKQSKMLAAVMIKKNIREFNSQQLAVQQQISQGDQQSKMVSHQSAIQIMQKELESKIYLIQVTEAEKRKTIAMEKGYDLQSAQFKSLVTVQDNTAQRLSDQLLMDKKIDADISRISAKGPETGKRKQ